MRRRPNAEDRSIADFIRRMPAGSRYDVRVESALLANNSWLAKLKTEGSCEIAFEDKVITIVPHHG